MSKSTERAREIFNSTGKPILSLVGGFIGMVIADQLGAPSLVSTLVALSGVAIAAFFIFKK